MNILYITNHLNISGITSYILTLAKGLKAKGHNIYIASSGGEFLSKFIEEGISYIPIPITPKSEVSPWMLSSMFKLVHIIRENKIDIIHSHSRATQVLGYLLSRKNGVKHIFTCHGFFNRGILRKLFPCWGKKVIAISDAVKDHLIKDFGVNEKDIKVIYNGIDLNRFKPQDEKHKVEIKKILGLSNSPVVGIVSRIAWRKGHFHLMEAINEVLTQIPKVQLLIVGEGEKRKKDLVELSEKLGMGGNVFFTSVLDVAPILPAMDVFALPSLNEGLGLALMEAMAVGLPVIGSRVGGIINLIQDGRNGLLVESQDTKSLATAILELLRNPEKRATLGKEARIFIAKNFPQEKMVLQTEGVYLECACQKD